MQLAASSFTSTVHLIRAMPFAVALAFAPGLAAADAAPAYRDAALAPEARARDLVARMTLQEKAEQMQNAAPAIERLGLKRYDWWNEVLHGVARAGHATVFPQAIGLAATWDTALTERLADAIALEGRANFNAALRRDAGGTARYFGVNYWTPNINIYRDPRWGRGQETYGEDPHLAGQLGMAFIRGIQGNDPKLYKGVATPKHFVVHSGPEPERHSFNVDVSPFDLEDTYLPAFRNAIVDAKAYSLMCAYNAVDGIPMCAHPLQNRLVRKDWGFQGFIVSDCDSVSDLVTGHKTSPDIPHAAATAVKAGTDLVCGRSYLGLPDAVARGLITEAEIDTSLVRLLAARIRMGLLDGSAWDRVPYSAINSPGHRALAQQAAEEAIVLLKNGGNVLPLAAGARIAVIGPNAALLQSLEGNYNGTIVHPTLPVDALRKAFGAARVTYAAGAPLIDGKRMPIPETFLKVAADSGQHGLRGEYFDNLEFAGKPKMTRIDPVINFNFEHSAPQGFEPRKFSVRWTGVLVPPKPGQYELGFRMIVPRDRPLPNIKVWIDDELVVSPEKAGIGGGNTAECVAGNCQQRMEKIHFTFDDTRPRRVRIDYARTENDRHSALEWVAPRDALVDGAVAAARASDVAVALVGLSPDLEGEEMKVDFPGFRGGDRLTLALPDAQRRMLEAVKATGKPLVVVYLTGGPISDPWVEANADAIVHAWYPGEGGGAAIARVLAGQVSPAGRLPYTIVRSEADLPPFADYSMRNRTYRYFNGPVLHPFGHGLSYTSFRYAAPKLSATRVKAGQAVKATVTVRNTGKRDSDEVVQLYLARPGDRANPVLAGFRRVHVKAGGSRTVTVELDARAQSQVDAKGGRFVRAGEYTVYAGGGQPKFAQVTQATLRVDGEFALPK
ncbi:glycoside hydrolase family 3 C-terminal domain-containing protein [Pseudoduganella sp. SL102]|uniref:glycoside hydrolase family 3 C-terminal domain-containing protein n=1 Tax=Pseudoduganella sp. SL102 TaxID=2995154 RepID=UPI00248C6054|nr:glycoside hydrolase family 3 C-terminal domain-containing protein [Pseudoduganella sp. SL102]WBS05541.1 glycoside hydrolase family 3 C-terminal domain-containing protein [Pseudoduganella sp. SL102]